MTKRGRKTLAGTTWPVQDTEIEVVVVVNQRNGMRVFNHRYRVTGRRPAIVLSCLPYLTPPTVLLSSVYIHHSIYIS